MCLFGEGGYSGSLVLGFWLQVLSRGRRGYFGSLVLGLWLQVLSRGGWYPSLWFHTPFPASGTRSFPGGWGTSVRCHDRATPSPARTGISNSPPPRTGVPPPPQRQVMLWALVRVATFESIQNSPTISIFFNH